MSSTKSRVFQATQAHELHTEVEVLVKSQFRSDIRLGEKLYVLKRENLYKKAIGEGISTWGDYLRQPEVSITAFRAAKLILLGMLLVLAASWTAIIVTIVHFISKFW